MTEGKPGKIEIMKLYFKRQAYLMFSHEPTIKKWTMYVTHNLSHEEYTGDLALYMVSPGVIDDMVDAARFGVDIDRPSEIIGQLVMGGKPFKKSPLTDIEMNPLEFMLFIDYLIRDQWGDEGVLPQREGYELSCATRRFDMSSGGSCILEFTYNSEHMKNGIKGFYENMKQLITKGNLEELLTEDSEE